MKGNYKVVVNTAAGRRRYLQYLIPLVLESDIVDRYDLWVNTTDKLDIAFLEEVAKAFPKINLIWQPENVVNGCLSISAFYKYCCDEDTIYIKLDDDIVWLEPNFFEELVSFRISHRDYFLVSPLVINNCISTYILQSQGLISFKDYFEATSYNLKWYNGYFAKELHDWFIDTYLLPKSYEKLHCGSHEIALNRFAINAVAWFGEDLSAFDGNVVGDDEEFLSVIYPSKSNKTNCFHCNTIAAHFSFTLQRAVLDKTNLLTRYSTILEKENRPASFYTVYNKIQEILEDIEHKKDRILSAALSHPYVQIKLVQKHDRIVRLMGVFLKVNKAYLHKLIPIYTSILRANRKYIK